MYSLQSEETVVSKQTELRHRPGGGALRFSLSEDTMAASSTDVDRTHWVESEAGVKPEASFQKKKRDNVNNHSVCMFIITLHW